MDWPRGQYYIWNGYLRQVLPGSRDGTTASKDWKSRTVKGKTRVYHKGNLTMEEYTYGLVRRESHHMVKVLTGAPGMLMPVLGLGVPEVLEDARPGFAIWGTPPGEERRLHLLVRGTEPFLPATYLLPNTREETGSMQGYKKVVNLAKVLQKISPDIFGPGGPPLQNS